MLSLNHLSLQPGPSWGYKCAQSQTQPPLPSFSHHPARVTAWGTLLTQPSGLTLDTVLPYLGSSKSPWTQEPATCTGRLGWNLSWPIEGAMEGLLMKASSCPQ